MKVICVLIAVHLGGEPAKSLGNHTNRKDRRSVRTCEREVCIERAG